MKIQFEDKSYIECYKSDTPGKIILVIQAVDASDRSKKTTNSCEITAEEFQKLYGDVIGLPS